MPKLLSGKVKVLSPEQLTLDRYNYISLNQSQPSLGRPATDTSILVGNLDGTTYWVPQSEITSKSLPLKNMLFVATNGNDNSDGASVATPKQTIAAAIGSASSGTVIMVFGGEYLENNPLIIPENVSIIGYDSKVDIIPKNPLLDVFKLNSGSGVENLVVKNHKAPAFAFSLADNITIIESPRIVNCESISGPYLKNGTKFIPYQTVQSDIIAPSKMPLLDSDVSNIQLRIDTTAAGGGIHLNGDKINQASYTKTVFIENFVAENQGGIGILAENNIFVQVDSSVTKFCSAGFKTTNGANMTLNSCTTEYGLDGLIASGFYSTAFNTGIVAESSYSYISSTSLSNNGTGYVSPPSVAFGTEWTALSTVALNTQVFYGNNLYVATTAGTFSNTAPTHSSGSVINGTVDLLCTGHVAEASVTISNGSVSNITITEQGYGYIEPPTLHFTGACTTPASGIGNISGISDISVGTLSHTPISGTIVKIGNASEKETLTSVTPSINGLSSIKIYPNIRYVVANTSVDFYFNSTILANGHSFKYAGSGTTLNAMPENGGVPDNNKEVSQINYGKVYYSSVNESGNYKIGDVFEIDLITNTTTLNAETFNLANLGAIGPLVRDGSPSGVQLKEISNDTSLIASTGFIDRYTAPTQYAVATYLNDNYLPLNGDSTVTGEITINDIILNGNIISSKNTNQSIILNPNGTGTVNVSASRIINLIDPVSGQDAATKAYVDDVFSGGMQASPSLNIGDFYIHQDVIENTINNSNMYLTTTGVGQVIITSTLQSSGSTSGALYVMGGVSIDKNLYVAGEIHSDTLVGNLLGSASTAANVTNSSQPNITSIGTLTSLQVDNINLNGNTIKNTFANTDLVLGITGFGGVVPETNNQINLGSINYNWKNGYFDSLYGTVKTASQPNISSLSANVSLYDNTDTLTPSLSIGFNNANRIIIEAKETGTNFEHADFTTQSSGSGGNFRFYPKGSLALTIDDVITASKPLYATEKLHATQPLTSIGPESPSYNVAHDTGFQYTNNIDINSYITSITLTSNGITNSTELVLNDTVANIGIIVGDIVSFTGINAPVGLNSSWVVSIANPTSTSIFINVDIIIPIGQYILSPTVVMLSKQGFFGYKQSLDALTIIPNATITNNIVSGEIGTVNAKIVSSSVNIDGGTIDNTVIGETTPSTGNFTMVYSNRYETTTVVNISVPVGNIVTQDIDVFPCACADIAKYIIKIKRTDVTPPWVSGQDLLVVHDGIDIYLTEYGIEYTDEIMGSFNAVIDSNTKIVTLQFTPSFDGEYQMTLFRFYA